MPTHILGLRGGWQPWPYTLPGKPCKKYISSTYGTIIPSSLMIVGVKSEKAKSGPSLQAKNQEKVLEAKKAIKVPGVCKTKNGLDISHPKTRKRNRQTLKNMLKDLMTK